MHFVKSVQIRSFFWSVFSRIRTGYGKIWTRKTRYLDTFHTAVPDQKLLMIHRVLKSYNSKKIVTNVIVKYSFYLAFNHSFVLLVLAMYKRHDLSHMVLLD